MHNLSRHDDFTHVEFAHRSDEAEVEDDFHIEQVHEQLHGKRGFDLTHSARCKIYCVTVKFYFADSNACYRTLINHVAEFLKDRQSFFRHSGYDCNSHILPPFYLYILSLFCFKYNSKAKNVLQFCMFSFSVDIANFIIKSQYRYFTLRYLWYKRRVL